MNTKTLGRVEITDVDKGEVTAVFSTFNVIDSDGDVTLPGAFTDGTLVRISAYGHASWGGALPVGKGVVRTTPKEAILDGQFFMNTQHGRDTFEVVKEMGELQEWSYSVEPTKHSFGEFDGQRVQFLEKLKGPHEVSPVLAGAGIDTRTLAVKSSALLRLVAGVDPHTTPVVDEPWDGYETTKGIPTTARPADLRGVYALVSPDGAKTGYAHHHGMGGPANIRACLAGIATLNSAQSDIADAARKSVYDHLAAHLRDAGREPPELRTAAGGERKLYDELVEGLAGLSALLDSTARVVALRADKGKELSAVNTEVLGWISDDLTRLKSLLSPPSLPDITNPPADEPPGLGEDDIRTLMAATARVLSI